MQRPSKYHKNKKPHNWLVYTISDRFINKFRNLYRGVLIDLGCGEAPYRNYFLQFVERYIGVDWSESQHQLNHVDIIANMNESINIDSNFADTIVSFAVIEHISEPQTFLNEAYRILKVDGNLILHAPWQWHLHEAPYDFFRYSEFGLKHMLTKAGFVDINIFPIAGFFTTMGLKFNYFLGRLIKKLPKPLMYLLALFCLPFWTLTQLLSPIFDMLDKNWSHETIGFFITAKKTSNG